jgi:predicted transposase/invertase (TIGR01784 family)
MNYTHTYRPLDQEKSRYQHTAIVCAEFVRSLGYYTQKGIAQGITQGIEKGITQGIEKGIAKGKEEMVRNLLADGVSLDVIVKSSGLPVNRIKALIN